MILYKFIFQCDLVRGELVNAFLNRGESQKLLKLRKVNNDSYFV